MMRRLAAAALWLIAAGLAAQTPAPSRDRVPEKLTRVVSASPSWSPDGKKILFHSNRNSPRPESYDLFVMNADGSGVVRLTDHPGTEMNGMFSPDGSRIVFVSDRDGNLEIYAMKADGSEPKRLTHDPGEDIHPFWSPDGAGILFNSTRTSKKTVDPEIYEIYSMNADGTGLQQITRDGVVNTYAVWSPNGRKIAFRKIVGENSEVFVMNADGTEQVNLTRNPGFDGWPAWSPDGSRLAFSTNRTGSFQVHMMKADGSGTVRLVESDGRCSGPMWSPDGKRIAFTQFWEGTTAEVFAIDVQ
jgi:TolB protein